MRCHSLTINRRHHAVWQSFDGVDAGSVFVLYPPLGPESFRGALQAEARKEVLHDLPKAALPADASVV